MSMIPDNLRNLPGNIIEGIKGGAKTVGKEAGKMADKLMGKKNVSNQETKAEMKEISYIKEPNKTLLLFVQASDSVNVSVSMLNKYSRTHQDDKNKLFTELKFLSDNFDKLPGPLEKEQIQNRMISLSDHKNFKLLTKDLSVTQMEIMRDFHNKLMQKL